MASLGNTAGRRVLLISENLSVPFDSRVWKEAKTLAKAGYRVDVVCPQGTTRDRLASEEIEGVCFHRYPLSHASSGALAYLLEYGRALRRTLKIVRNLRRRGPFDVLHACNPPDLFFLIALVLRPDGTRLVFDHHDLVPELFRSRFPDGSAALYRISVWLERATFALADAVISTNESYRQVAIRRGKVPADRVTVVRSAPDITDFHPVTVEPDLKRGKAHLACYLGVMGPQDGVDYALRALAYVRHELGRTDLHSVFVGAGDAYEDSVRLMHTLGLSDCVEFTGRIPDAAVLRYLSTADICLSPDPRNPLNDVSSMNKVVEYMAVGRPLVSFDLVEARFTAADAAVYAADNDEREFAKCIDELLDDPDRRSKMGRIGRSRVEQLFSWEISQEHLLCAYEDVLQRPSRSLLRALRGGVR